MANTDVINLIFATFADAFTYLLPIIAVLAGVNFVFQFLIYIMFGTVSRTFKG